jgi:phage recombination protein Bet
VSDLARQIDGVPEWESKVDLIRRTVAAGATADELELFFHQARRSGLDPLAKQIYFVKRQGKGVVQVGIDGLRLIADRTGAYAGSDDSVFTAPNDRGFPNSATITVWKMVGGQRCPFAATARWDEYFPGDAQGFQWKRMPHTMLAKCAEALALRKGFPADLSGLYIHEEMDQAGADWAADPKAANGRAPLDAAEGVTPHASAAQKGSVSDAQTATGSNELQGQALREAARETFADGNASANDDGKNAFGYSPMRWPSPKMFSEPLTESQAKMTRVKARERMLDLDELPVIRRLVLEAFGLDDGNSKAHQSLFIDWLISADDETLDRAAAASEAEPRPELEMQ